jgi:hypothetical protein
MRPLQLFLSYNSSDRTSVIAVQKLLEARGIATFLDRDKLGAGLPWPQALEEGLRNVRGVAAIAWKFFGKDAQWVRIGAFLVIIASIVFVVFLLALPIPNKEVAKADAATVPIAVSTPQDTKPTPIAKQCTGEKDIIFTPQMPGVMQTTPDGRRVDLGDGGGGTRLEKWAYSWKAPATVTSARCTVQRNEHVLAQNRDGSNAECEGSINGGNDAMTMHVTWDGPCDQQ